MLDDRYLDQTLSKEEYDAVIDGLRERVGVLQREFRDRKIPVILVFEGWRFSGLSETINRLTYALDPRGYRVYHTALASDIERAHPPLWKFWVNTPLRDRIALFDRSWYTDLLLRNTEGGKKDRVPKEDLADIRTFETQLADDGNLIIKFFLHISRKEYKNRLSHIKRDHPEFLHSEIPAVKTLLDYKVLLPRVDRMLEETNTRRIPWTLVEATDRRYTLVKVYRTLISRMEAALQKRDGESPAPPGTREKKTPRSPRPSTPLLDGIDLSCTLTEAEYEKRLARCEARLKELQYAVHEARIPVVIAFEGWDAAGKGGAIIRLDRALNPRCSVVEPVASPTPDEKSHHYLWRFYRNFPRAGTITIFDRTWYGRVMVERVEGFCTEEEWRRAYDEINAMEEYLVRSGTVLIKFWLQIDQATQLQRFRERETDPLKKYKITDEDWRNREKWDEYCSAIEEMLVRTNTKKAPWVLVPANDKHYARIMILEAVIAQLERGVSSRKKKRK